MRLGWDYLINPKTEKNERNSKFGRGRAGRNVRQIILLGELTSHAFYT